MLDGTVLLRQKRDEVREGTLSCPDRNLAVFHHYRHYEGLRLLPSVYDSKLIQQTLIMKSNIGIQIILSIVLTMCSININAQTVGYTYRPLAAEGCNMKYSVAKQDTAYYIIATVKSDRLNFLKESTMLLKTFDGEVIKLYGSQIGSGSETAGIVSGNIVLPVTEISSTAQFKISPQQFELLKKGVAKIRLSTIPIEHERTFAKDKIGKKLYQFFLKQKNKDNDF